MGSKWGSSAANVLILNVPCSVFSKQEIVFARTSPKHKLEIGGFQTWSTLILDQRLTTSFVVKRAQALGHIVGV